DLRREEDPSVQPGDHRDEKLGKSFGQFQAARSRPADEHERFIGCGWCDAAAIIRIAVGFSGERAVTRAPVAYGDTFHRCWEPTRSRPVPGAGLGAGHSQTSTEFR